VTAFHYLHSCIARVDAAQSPQAAATAPDDLILAPKCAHTLLFSESFQGSHGEQMKHSRFRNGAGTGSHRRSRLKLIICIAGFRNRHAWGMESADLEKQCAMKQVTNKRKEVAVLF
jgi:hypothetical protein